MITKQNIQFLKSLTVSDRVSVCEKRLDLFFAYYCSHYISYQFAPFHYEWFKDMHDLIKGDITELCLIAYRESAKTSLALGLLLYQICYEGNEYINVDSYDSVNAKRLLFDVVLELQTNKRILNDFGQIYNTKRTADEVTQKSVKDFVTNPTYDKEGNKIKEGIRVEAHSTGQPVRGRRHGAFRPQLLCHEKGTKIFDGKWLNVEDHNGLLGIRKEDGLEVKIHSLPYSEVVTKEHRYWVRTIRTKKASYSPPSEVIFEGWKEAKDLTKYDFIGLPIDYTENQNISIRAKSGSIIEKRNSKGQVLKHKANYIQKRLPDNPLFWWMVGYWVGDGHKTKTQLGFTIADKDDHARTMITDYCKAFKKPYSVVKRSGCSQYMINDTALARYLGGWRIGNSQKIPPKEVEQLSIRLQKEYVKGYIQADGWRDTKHNEVRLTSVCLEGLYVTRRILSRIGIPSSIRHGMKAGLQKFPNGQICKTQKKYDLRFRLGANLLGYEIKNTKRYTFPETHIDKDYLWSKVKSVKEVKNREFCPIKTETHTYQTHYGLSHNCIDDFENEQTIRSEAYTDEIHRHIQSFKGGLDSAKGRVLYLANYLSEFANVQSIIERSKIDPNLRVRIVPISDELGPTWPEKYGEEQGKISIEALRKRMWTPENGDDDFMAEMMCRPIDYSNSEFKKEWFEHRYMNVELEGLKLNNYICIDNAPSLQKNSDWIGCVVVSVDIQDNWYLRYVKRYKADTPALISEIFRLYEEYKPIAIGIEQKGYESLIKPFLEQRSKELKIYPYFVELKDGGRHKEDRIRGALQGRFKMGMIKLLRYVTDDTNELIKELAQFPNGKYDDLADSLAYGVQISNSPVPNMKQGPTTFEQYKQEDIRSSYANYQNKNREIPDTI